MEKEEIKSFIKLGAQALITVKEIGLTAEEKMSKKNKDEFMAAKNRYNSYAEAWCKETKKDETAFMKKCESWIKKNKKEAE